MGDFLQRSPESLAWRTSARAEPVARETATHLHHFNHPGPDFDATIYDDRIRVLRVGGDWTHLFGTGTELTAGLDLSQGLPVFGSRGFEDATLERPVSRVEAEDDFTKSKVSGHTADPWAGGRGAQRTRAAFVRRRTVPIRAILSWWPPSSVGL